MEISKTRVSEIKTLHDEIEDDLKTCLDKAVRIGELLAQTKEELKHGEFIRWILENLPFTDRTARNYMKLHARQDELAEANNINEAYRLLAPESETVSVLIEETQIEDGTITIEVLEADLKQKETDFKITVQDIEAEKDDKPDPDFLVSVLVETIKKQDDKDLIFRQIYEILQYPDGHDILRRRFSHYK